MDIYASMGEVLKPKPLVKLTLDSSCDDKTLDSAADAYTTTDITLKTVASIQQWLESDDLDDGESYADRLLAMLIGIADANKDGDISEDEQGVLDIALNSAWDYLGKYDVAEDDISALLNDWDSDAAERIRDLLATSLPEGEEADADMDNFVFGGDQEAALDATYKKTMVVRGGRKVRINKRVSGTVRLSARQKMAIRKASMKSHSAVAQMHRAKSMRVRRKSNL
ncbi:MAG: hypothetical protein ACXWT0_00275 [Methylobacter sp.]